MKDCKKHSYCRICRPDISIKFSTWAKQRYEDSCEREKAKKLSTGRVPTTKARQNMSKSAKLRAVRDNSVKRLQTPEARMKMAITKRGKPTSLAHHVAMARSRGSYSDEHKHNISLALKRHAISCIKPCHNGTSPSKVAWGFIDFLNKVGFSIIIPEVKLGPYSVDCVLGDEWLGFEVDGEYWHRNRDHTKRDKYLLEQFDLPIIRITEKEAKQLGTPNAQPQPGTALVGEEMRR